MSQLLLVAGPPGSGKTAGARHIADRVREAGRSVRVYMGRSEPGCTQSAR